MSAHALVLGCLDAIQHVREVVVYSNSMRVHADLDYRNIRNQLT